MPDPVTEIFDQLFGPIKYLLDGGYYGAAGICSLSAIDAMGNLNRPADADENAPSDFKHWVTTYLRLDGETVVSGEEWWSMRNAVLHTFGAESRSQRQGTVTRNLAFTMTTRTPAIKVYQPTPPETRELVAINLLALQPALVDAATRFFIDVERDPVRKALLDQRLNRVLMNFDLRNPTP